MLIRVLTVCYHHRTMTSPHTVLPCITQETADRYGANSSMHFLWFSIINLLQNLLPTASQHLFNTLSYTPLTLYKQIYPHMQQDTLHASWLAHTLVLHSHILGPTTCVHTHTPKWASRGAALLRLPETAEQLVGLLWREGPDAVGLTPCRHSSWNTPGLSVQTFFNLICIRPSLDPKRLRGGGWQRGCGQKKYQHTAQCITPCVLQTSAFLLIKR